jgi:hypothetical protein
VTDAGLALLAAGCPQLQELGLAGCPRVTDAAAVSLAALPQLAVLDLSGANQVTPAGVGALKRLPLKRLVVDAECLAAAPPPPAAEEQEEEGAGGAPGALHALLGDAAPEVAVMA